jgi:hypothetical protein
MRRWPLQVLLWTLLMRRWPLQVLQWTWQMLMRRRTWRRMMREQRLLRP